MIYTTMIGLGKVTTTSNEREKISFTPYMVRKIKGNDTHTFN